MRDNIVSELRFAAKKWKEDNQRILFTGEIDVGQALSEAADAIEALSIECKEWRERGDALEKTLNATFSEFAKLEKEGK